MLNSTIFGMAFAALGFLSPMVTSAGTDDATWPVIEIDPLIKDNLARAYKAADDPKGGPDVAAAFTEGGVFTDLGMTFTGRQVISNAITTAFESGFAEQTHTIYAVFADQSPGLELMLRGHAKAVMKNGTAIEGDFVAWAVTDKASYEAGDPKLSHLHIFSA